MPRALAARRRVHGYGSCLKGGMEPFPSTAVAVEWEFRCHGKAKPGHPWDWRCRSRDGEVVATSTGYFKSLREAVADASTNGFLHESLPEGR